jgi:hypothetical protein
MIRAGAIALLLTGLSSPVFATEWINCSDAGGAASFDFLVGGADVMFVDSVTISVGEQVWASDVANGPGNPVQVGQSFANDEMILIDAVDAGALVAELRLWTEVGDEAAVYAGTLNIPGTGVWAVSCSGP